MPPDLPSSEALPVGHERIIDLAKVRKRLSKAWHALDTGTDRDTLRDWYADCFIIIPALLDEIEQSDAALDLARRELGDLHVALDPRTPLNWQKKYVEAASKLAAAELVVEAARRSVEALAERDHKPGWTQQHLYHTVDDLAEALGDYDYDAAGAEAALCDKEGEPPK